jgi:hypothetical protein
MRIYPVFICSNRFVDFELVTSMGSRMCICLGGLFSLLYGMKLKLSVQKEY